MELNGMYSITFHHLLLFAYPPIWMEWDGIFI
jgi:hypothetical protein